MIRRAAHALLTALLLAVVAAPPAGAAARIAVTQIRPTGTGITLLDLAGGRTTLTARAGVLDDDPAWSPDGAHLVFTRSADGRRSFHLYVLRTDGRGLRRITHGRFDERADWAPNARWIAYQAIGGLRLVHPDGTADHAIPGAAGGTWPAFSPDGRRLAFSRGGAVLTLRLRDHTVRRLAAGREPDWSPDGRTIAFTGPDGGIRTVAVTGGRPRSLHAGLQPAWSPDGARIAFTRWPASGAFSVWVMAADGRGARRLLGDARSPAWAPQP